MSFVADLLGFKEPDTSGVNDAARINANISKEALDFYRQEYERTRPDREAAAARAALVSDAQLEQTRFATQQAQDLDVYNRETFRPLERQIVAEANAYDTAGRRDREAGEAIADVTQQFENTRDSQSRQLTRMGVNPNDGRYAGMSNSLLASEALAKATAANRARKTVEQQGYARMVDAAGFGRNVVGNQGTFLAASTNSGNSSVANQNSSLNAQTSGSQLMGQGFTTALNGNASSGSLFGTAANIQGNIYGQQLAALSGLGQAAGTFYGGK